MTRLDELGTGKRPSALRFLSILGGVIAASLSAAAIGEIQYESAKLVPADGQPYGHFGRSIAIDGDMAVVGAEEAAYIFVQDHVGNWGEEAKLEASDSSPSDNFGRSVALRDDTALIGAFGAGDNGSTRGAAYVFTRDGQGDWTERSKLSSSDGHWGDRFGYAVALQGDTALISAPGANSSPSGPGPGVVYVFTREGAGKWTEVAKLQASDGLEDDEFGYAVALDGDIALIAAPSDDGNGEDSGSAYIFIRNEAGHWLEQAKLLNLDGSAWDHFGRSVALDGTTALISADGDDDIGSVHVFDYNSAGQWTERDKILASDGAAGDVFGASIATTDRAAVIGAYGDEYNGWGSGAAYVYTQDGEGKWTEKAKLLASDRASDDQFGNSIAIDGNTIIVGAFANDDDGTNSGSAYVFSLATTKYVWTMVGGGRINSYYLIKLDLDGEEQWRTQFGQSLAIGVDPRDGSVWAGELRDEHVVEVLSDGCIFHRVPGLRSNYVGVNPNDGSVWVGLVNENQILKLAPDGSELFRVPGFDFPSSLAFDLRENTVWVADGGGTGGRKIVKLGSNGEVLWRRSVPHGFWSNAPHQVSVDSRDGSAWHVGISSSVYKRDSSGSLVRTVTGFDRPTSAAIDPRDGSVWITDFSVDSPGALVKLDENGNELLRQILATPPHAVAVNPEDGSVWVSVDNALVKLSAAGEELGTFPVPGIPRAIVVSSEGSSSGPGDGQYRMVLNDLMSFEPDPSTYYFAPNGSRCPSGFVGKFGFEAQLANISPSTLSDLQIRVAEISKGNLVVTPSGLASGACQIFPVSRAGGYMDGLLAPGEFVDVPFTICLKSTRPFQFFVDVLGREWRD